MFRKVSVIARKGTLVFSLEDKGIDSYLTVLDYEGRVRFVLKNRRAYRRGVDNRVISSDLLSREFTVISSKDAERVLREVYEDLRSVIVSGEFEVLEVWGGDEELVRRALRKIVFTGYENLVLDAGRGRYLFGDVSILPPDQYMSLYVPIAEGCPYNRCSFCAFYRDRKFRVKGKEEIVSLVKGIVDFFGAGLLAKRGVFLGEGNVFAIATEEILFSIGVIKDILGNSEYITFNVDENFYGFMDTFGMGKDKSEMRLLKEAGVRRVYIGVESGNDFILRNILLKPLDSQTVLRTVFGLKEVGISVGVIVLVGVGGKEFKEEHFDSTFDLVSRMELSCEDIIYLSPIVEYKNVEYSGIMDKMNLTRLSQSEMESEILRLREAFSRVSRAKVAIYRVDRFLYM